MGVHTSMPAAGWAAKLQPLAPQRARRRLDITRLQLRAALQGKGVAKRDRHELCLVLAAAAVVGPVGSSFFFFWATATGHAATAAAQCKLHVA